MDFLKKLLEMNMKKTCSLVVDRIKTYDPSSNQLTVDAFCHIEEDGVEFPVVVHLDYTPGYSGSNHPHHNESVELTHVDCLDRKHDLNNCDIDYDDENFLMNVLDHLHDYLEK